jgi:hypothetical protein
MLYPSIRPSCPWKMCQKKFSQVFQEEAQSHQVSLKILAPSSYSASFFYVFFDYRGHHRKGIELYNSTEVSEQQPFGFPEQKTYS